MTKPLLLVDVDGVVSLFGFDPSAPPEGRWVLIDGIPHLLSASAGRHVSRLAASFEIVWCTGWEERAEEHLPRSLGFAGGFEHLSFGDGSCPPDSHWKLAAIEAFAGPTRPLAWIDDQHNGACLRWQRLRPGPTLLLATDPAVGLREEDVVRLESWAHQHTAASL